MDVEALRVVRVKGSYEEKKRERVSGAINKISWVASERLKVGRLLFKWWGIFVRELVILKPVFFIQELVIYLWKLNHREILSTSRLTVKSIKKKPLEIHKQKTELILPIKTLSFDPVGNYLNKPDWFRDVR